MRRSRSVILSASQFVVLLVNLLFLLSKAGSITCVTNVFVNCEATHDSWCTCQGDEECYASLTKYLDDSGEVQSIQEYGCLSFPQTCPTSVRGIQFSDTVAYQAFNCCRGADFCNENLTVNVNYPLPPSPSPTPTQPFVSPSLESTSESSTTSLPPYLLTVVVVIVTVAVVSSLVYIVVFFIVMTMAQHYFRKQVPSNVDASCRSGQSPGTESKSPC